MKFDPNLKRHRIHVPPGKRLIWRPYRWVGGRRLYCRDYGKKAWPILVDDDQE